MQLVSDNYNDKQSSCYFLDLRNSTYITRKISLDGDHKKSEYSQRLKDHAEFMLGIHRFLTTILEKLNSKEYYYNDTGDGHLCLFWDKDHAATALKLACSMGIFLKKKLAEYNDKKLSKWSQEINATLSLDFGIGLHSGGSLVYNDMQRNFAFGIVLNTAARVESYTKNFTTLPLLLTKNFVNFLESHLHPWEKYGKLIKQVTKYNVDIKDSKIEGHLLYTVLEQDWRHFCHP